MKWTSLLSTKERLDDALAESAHAALAELGEAPDLVLVFPSQHYAADFDRLPEILAAHLEGGILAGCSAGAVIGGGHEIEERPAVTMAAALLPGVDIHPFHVEQEDLPDLDSSPRAWQEMVGIAGNPDPHFVLLADPFSVHTDRLLEGLDYAYPRGKKIGGLASGAERPGANALYLGHRVWQAGAIGVALTGNVTVDTVVAQGCRPIGRPLRVTASRDNLLLGLEGRRPVELLREAYETLDQHDQELAKTALHLGVLTNELQEEMGPGSFLVRNILGIDARNGILAVGERLREGQTVQFHLRDARTSADDLDTLLEQYSASQGGDRPAGALLFSCLGRGTHLYGRPDHDSDLFRRRLGAIPVGGFFCSGEIGPVGQSTYLHGFTSSFGLFKPR